MTDEAGTNRLQDYLSITKRYYAEWLDVDPTVLDGPGVFAVPSSRREERQAGYSRVFELYCFVSGETTVISYHRRFQDRKGDLVRLFALNGDLEETKTGLAELLGVAPPHACVHARTHTSTGLCGCLKGSTPRGLVS